MHKAQNHIVLSDEELFRLIDATIHRERLYADPTLQRGDIMKRYGLRRQHLNEILNTYAGGQGFPSYINTMRLEEAVILMKEKPGMSLSEIAEAVGFSLPNFRIQFKKRYGVNPIDFRIAQQAR